MSSFTLLVTHSPFDSQSAYTAYRFAAAAVALGHTVNGIFFYQSGVANGNRFQSGHSDEINLYNKWCELEQQHNIPLQVCVTAANRRGVINEEDANEIDSRHFNLSAPFQEVGLGDLINLLNQSDRTVQF